MPLITNQIYHSTFGNSCVASNADQFPKGHQTHNPRNPNMDIPQSHPTDAHKTKESTNLPNISSTPKQYLFNQDKSVNLWIDKLDPCETR